MNKTKQFTTTNNASSHQQNAQHLRVYSEYLPRKLKTRCVAVCCSALQCVAVRCSALQCVAVYQPNELCRHFGIFPCQIIKYTYGVASVSRTD